MRILTAKNQGLIQEINTKRDLMVGSKSKSIPLELEEYNGIHLNFPMRNLDGFKNVYDFPYSHGSTTEELRNIANNYPNSKVCVGARYKDLETISVLGCGDSQSIFNITTSKDSAFLHKGAYWYLNSQNNAFGFSGIQNISLYSSCDLRTENAGQRLCWIFDTGVGGYRAGVDTKLYYDDNWRKVIYLTAN